jgi:hypothetical protein
MAAEIPVFAFLPVTFERVPEIFFYWRIWKGLFVTKNISHQRMPGNFFSRSYLKKTKCFFLFFELFVRTFIPGKKNSRIRNLNFMVSNHRQWSYGRLYKKTLQ